MADPRGRDSMDEDKMDKMERLDRMDQSSDDDFEESSTMIGSGSNCLSSGETSGARSEIGLMERLTDVLVDEGGVDLLIQQTDGEDRLLQWIRALDVQVLGACRSDERLKPFLKMNVSNGVAEERLLAQLSQHFEPAEVGILARCFCLPLVSVRVGKIDKQGTCMYPTSNRGNLKLTLLPTSELRLSFIGDNGHVERISSISSKSQCSAVAINEIKEERSGRSFLIKVSDGNVFYFWCSEKSKLLGIELLAKMKDLLKRKPSIAELSGISESRLDCFATHLRAFLMGNCITSSCASVSSAEAVLDVNETSRNSSTSKFLRSRNGGNQAVKANNPYQGIVSRRSCSFKGSQPLNLSPLRSIAREKLRQYGNGIKLAPDSSSSTSASTNVALPNGLNLGKKPEVIKNSSVAVSLFSDSPGKLDNLRPFGSAAQRPPFIPSLLSLHYCWCPPGTSSMSISATSPPFLQSAVEPSSTPLFSSHLPSSSSTDMLPPCPPLDLSSISSVNFPSFLPDPLAHLPLPTTQQLPTFTPLMCDSIVHIPVIDVCSQGYLVSAGSAMSTTIPPLHPKLANPLIPETDSMVEEGARETLRLLLSGSTQANQQILDDLPDVLTNVNESLVLSGNGGLYSGDSGTDTIAKSIAAMGLFPISVTPKVNNTSSGFSDESSHGGYEVDDASSDDGLETGEGMG